MNEINVLFEERTVLVWPSGVDDTADVYTKLVHTDMGFPFGPTYILRVNMYMSEHDRRDDLNVRIAVVLDGVFTDAAAIRRAIAMHDAQVAICKRNLADIGAEIGAKYD